MKNPAVILLILLLFSTGCSSTKEPYLLKAYTPETVTGFPVPKEAAETPNLPQTPTKTVAFSGQKVRSKSRKLAVAAQTAKTFKRIAPAISMQAAERNLVKLSQKRFQASNHSKLELTQSRQNFPVVWFIILSILLGTLLIYYLALASESGGPPVEMTILILIVPIAIPWLIIAAKPVAAALGWPGFWTFLAMLLAIILFILFVNWLAKVQEKARSERYKREQIKKELERRDIP